MRRMKRVGGGQSFGEAPGRKGAVSGSKPDASQVQERNRAAMGRRGGRDVRQRVPGQRRKGRGLTDYTAYNAFGMVVLKSLHRGGSTQGKTEKIRVVGSLRSVWSKDRSPGSQVALDGKKTIDTSDHMAVGGPAWAGSYEVQDTVASRGKIVGDAYQTKDAMPSQVEK